MFIKQPKVNASITPSSKRAARGMVKGLHLDQMKYVVELGPGTGVFTDILSERLPADCKILLIELEEEYIKPLREKYDDRFEIVKSSACELEALLKERGVESVDLVISGLPYNMPEEVKHKLQETLLKLTNQGTCMRWFTYFPRAMKRHYRQFQMSRACFVMWNLPPMWIYTVN
jgi:phosphatidylethanolamine/phosphatidyl-N-methylethanolamine N-methyltransferase